jgi:ADP-dependent NAD(P)H-hydrate dehydratase / NAD(P)H-hydrate epimerase
VKRWRALLLLGAALAVVAVLLGAVALVLVPRYITREAIRRAREHGIELELGTLDYGWEWASISNAKARLVGVNGVLLRIDQLVVDLDGANVTRLDFVGLGVEADGSLPALLLEVSAWTKRYPSAYTLPLTARNVSVAWRPEPGRPWLEIEGATVATTPASTVVVAEHTRVAGIDIGRAGTTWSAKQSSVALGLGEAELEKSPLRLDADLSIPKPRVTATLAPMALDRLAGPFAVALPVQGVTASATLTLDFASRDAALPESGLVKLTLDGFIPPHPPELDGFVFGRTTTVESKLGFAPDGKTLTLSETSVTAGKFVLKGGGTLTREPSELKVSLALDGALPCDALAQAAAESRLGRLLGRLSGQKGGRLARQVVGGTVAVRVTIEGTTKDLAGAQINRTIGVGCGLRPLTLEDLRALGDTLLATDLQKLSSELEKLTGLPKGTLPVPSGLPTALPALPPPILPPLPEFPLLPPKDPKDPKASGTAKPTSSAR